MAHPPKKRPRLKFALTKKTNPRRLLLHPVLQYQTLAIQLKRTRNLKHPELKMLLMKTRNNKKELNEGRSANTKSLQRKYKTLLPYQQIGLYAPRCLTLYRNIAAVLKSGLECETKQMKAKTRTLQAPNGEESSDNDESDLDEDDLAERAHLLTIYDKISSTFPSTIARLLEAVIYDDAETYNMIVNVIDQAFSEARRNDTSRLKTEVLRFIPNVFQTYSDALPSMGEVVLLDPPCLCDAKSDRGVNHPMIAMLFCPF
ncbi:hypothetical protein EV360DRAFT_76023, partial [Lentinula raphanica]